MGSARVAKSLPLQVAAICYRRRGTPIEFLLVNTNGGNKWTFPKGSTEARAFAQPGRRTRSRGRSRRHRHDRASPLPSLHPFQGCVLAARRRAGICGQSLPDGDPRDAPSRRRQSPSHLGESGRSQAPPGQGPRSEIFPRTRSVIDRALERIQFHGELWGAYPGSAQHSATDPVVVIGRLPLCASVSSVVKVLRL